MADRGGEFSFFQGIHIRIDIIIDIPISIRPLTFTFGKQVHNQTGAGDVITSGLRDKLKTFYLHYQRAYGHQTWQMITYHDGLLPIKSHDPLIMWSCEITRQIKIIVSPLSECLWLSKLAGW